MSYRGQQRYSRYDRSYDQSSWDRDSGSRYSSRYSDSRSVDPSAQLAAANAILSAVLQTQKGSSYGRDRRENYYGRGSYRSRGRGYRGARSFRSRPYEDRRPRENKDYESNRSVDKTEEKAEGEGTAVKGAEEQKEEGKYRCHLCWKFTDTEEQHLAHLETSEHGDKMEERKARYRRQMQAIVFKLRNKEEFDQHRKGGRRGFCTVCNVNYYGLNTRHNTSPLHRDMRNLKQAYCRFCDLRFVERIDYDRHILTIKHLKIRARKLSQEEQMKPEDMEVLDSVGDDQDQEDLQFPDEWDGEEAVGQQSVKKVVGYFCKLCCKFFTEQEQKPESHCKEEAHYNSFVEYAKTKKEEIEKKKQEKKEAAKEEVSQDDEVDIKEEEENGDVDEEMEAEDDETEATAADEEDETPAEVEEETPAEVEEETPAEVEEEAPPEAAEEEQAATKESTTPRRGGRRGRPAKKAA